MNPTRANGSSAASQSEVTRLIPGPYEPEMILMRGCPSPVPTLWGIALLGVIMTGLVLALQLAVPTRHIPFVVLTTAWLGCLVLITAQGVLEWMACRNTNFVLTQKCLCLKRGIVRCWHKKLALARVQDVVIEQGPLGRGLGYGSVRVEAADESDGLVLNDVQNPLAWRAAILKATEHAVHK